MHYAIFQDIAIGMCVFAGAKCFAMYSNNIYCVFMATMMHGRISLGSTY